MLHSADPKCTSRSAPCPLRFFASWPTQNQNTSSVSPHLNLQKSYNTVDGRNPAPPNMYETLQIMGYLPYQLVSRISEPSTVSPCDPGGTLDTWDKHHVYLTTWHATSLNSSYALASAFRLAFFALIGKKDVKSYEASFLCVYLWVSIWYMIEVNIFVKKMPFGVEIEKSWWIMWILIFGTIDS